MVWWYVAYFVIALVVAYATMPKPASQPSPGLGEIKSPTAEEGLEIPVLFGTRDLLGPNVVWYGDIQVTAIKKSGGKK